ncbi:MULTISPECIES: type II secretion system F family protein [unclassified Yoonia]|uniref:type II secretion system F family protein n=1 Tax=unclassified Yoonia TaxID=2629118 RepID=UPI002AFE3FE9|nr:MULTISPECIES: type II secretion system F family protein [unclassified Yoonia]
MSQNLNLLLTFLLASIFVGGVLFAVLQPQLAHLANTKRRMRLVLGDGSSPTATHGAASGMRRQRSVEDTLKAIEEKQRAQAKSRSRKSLQSRLREADLTWSNALYYGLCVATAFLLFALFRLGFGMQAILACAFAMLGAGLLPQSYLRLRRNRKLKEFGVQFPDAIDVIVRGVKSGMPLGDCIRVVAFEGQEPVRSEFKSVVDDQTLGVPVQEAVQRLAERVPLPETNFLSIVITIQSRSGGNLTEALGNLSTVLRERKKMRGKIKAMSSEAKASAGIIGSLPPIVAFLLFLTSPDYISLLFNTTTGNVVLVVAAVWMLIGVLIMRKMINFDF